MAAALKKKSASLSSRRKKRVRRHIIADLSANYIERWVLLSGFTFESFRKDYGYDMIVSTFNSRGEFENGNILIQLKATDHINFVQMDAYVSLTISRRDILTWYNETVPVILILYDARSERAFWLYLQQYLRNLVNFDINTQKAYFTLRIPVHQAIDGNSFAVFRQYKININKQIEHVITYE